MKHLRKTELVVSFVHKVMITFHPCVGQYFIIDFHNFTATIQLHFVYIAVCTYYELVAHTLCVIYIYSVKYSLSKLQ